MTSVQMHKYKYITDVMIIVYLFLFSVIGYIWLYMPVLDFVFIKQNSLILTYTFIYRSLIHPFIFVELIKRKQTIVLL